MLKSYIQTVGEQVQRDHRATREYKGLDTTHQPLYLDLINSIRTYVCTPEIS